jgi:YD repeat-containing protein
MKVLHINPKLLAYSLQVPTANQATLQSKRDSIMKTLCVLILGLVFQLAPVSAQQTLPPSIQPYAVNWSYAVKQMLNAGGYNVPGPKAEFDFRDGTQGRSQSAALDSTVTYFGYNVGGGDSIPLFRNMYTYPTQGVEVITESFFEMGVWVPLSRTQLVADTLGRLVEATSHRYDAEAGEFIPDARIEFFAHGNYIELIDTLFVYAWSVELKAYVRQLTIRNAYDAHGQMTQSVSSIEIFDFPLVFEDHYKYDKEGQLTQVLSFNIDGNESIPAGKQELRYVNKQLTLTTNFISDGFVGFLPQARTAYAYHHKGGLQSQKAFDWDITNKKWVLTEDHAYAYDKDGKRTSATDIILQQNVQLANEKIIYTYTADDVPAMETSYVWNKDLQAYEMDQQRHYYYKTNAAEGLDETDDPVVADATFMYPNPTSGIVQVKLSGQISVLIYTISGQLIKKYALAHGERVIDLKDLPAGIYQVRAKSDEDYFSGKLLIQ